MAELPSGDERRSVLAQRLGANGFDPAAAVALALRGPQFAGGRSAEDDAKRLRGIPVVGGKLGGAVPGSRPGVTGRLGRWSGR